MKATKSLLCILIALLCMTLSCCNTENPNLTAQYSRSQAIPVYDFFAENTSAPENYQEFTSAYYDFAANLLINTNSKKSNSVASPLSLYTTLSMTATGASGKTLSQLEKLLGRDLSISEINPFIYYLNCRVQSLNTEENKVTSANSLWIRDEYSVKAQYLQTIVNYYDASVFRTNLASENGAEEINDWISKNTDGEIENMISELSEDTAMVLVNAMLFDDEWITPYSDESVNTGIFKGINGEEYTDFMTSNEMYIESTDARGFVKSYKNTPCKFVAILPDENITIDEYINSLSGSKLQTLLSSASGVSRCEASVPEFELRANLNLSEAVKAMGAELMFSENADFSSLTMSDNLRVTDVLQENFIKVSPQGTKASSASAVIMEDISAAPQEFEGLVFDRPFVFMIVENECNLPLYIGAVKTIN